MLWNDALTQKYIPIIVVPHAYFMCLDTLDTASGNIWKSLQLTAHVLSKLSVFSTAHYLLQLYTEYWYYIGKL